MDFLTPRIIYEFSLRWLHFMAGITWIGFLYWFNLVNVNFQKSLEADVKPKVNPKLIPPTLWLFRWSAALTFVTGFLYFCSILTGETATGMGGPLLAWIAIVGVTYAIIFNVVRPTGALNNGYLLAGIAGILVLAMAVVIYNVFAGMGVVSNSSYSIGIGGGIGTIMLLNVWGIIWPCQKRVLGLVPVPDGVDKTLFARRAFLASRMNTWLSIPMLFFMGASTHLPIFQRWY